MDTDKTKKPVSLEGEGFEIQGLPDHLADAQEVAEEITNADEEPVGAKVITIFGKEFEIQGSPDDLACAEDVEEELANYEEPDGARTMRREVRLLMAIIRWRNSMSTKTPLRSDVRTGEDIKTWAQKMTEKIETALKD